MPSRLQHCLLAACLGFAAIPSLAVDFGTPAIEVVDGAAIKGIQRVAVTSFTVQYVLEQVWDTSYTSGGTVNTQPQAGETVTGGCEFDIPCRFDSSIDLASVARGIRDTSDITIVEILNP